MHILRAWVIFDEFPKFNSFCNVHWQMSEPCDCYNVMNCAMVEMKMCKIESHQINLRENTIRFYEAPWPKTKENIRLNFSTNIWTLEHWEKIITWKCLPCYRFAELNAIWRSFARYFPYEIYNAIIPINPRYEECKDLY